MEGTASSSNRAERARQSDTLLDAAYPAGLGFLEAAQLGAFELLVAVILSAQTTDRQVNLVTGRLFETYPDAEALAAAERAEVERIIESTGYFRAKAAHIIGTARMLCDRFGGAVPDTMEDLTALPGVGRKSAGVILGAIYGKPAIIVDTHFGRVVRRIGLTAEQSPVKVEGDIAGLLAPERWYRFSMSVNAHGRAVCGAKRPQCQGCILSAVCLRVGLEHQ